MAMALEQFYLSCLSHASYMLTVDGVAVVVDPQRDVDLYLEAVASQGAKIAHIFETHLHADFVSGHRELAQRTGARVYISERAGATFPHVAVKDGFELRLGACSLRVLETPGHTPESICLALYDPEREPAPWAVLTGDTLFIGDVGRPDLSASHSPPQLAGMLYDSLQQKLLTLPDATMVYPAHGAGSLCGRNMRAERYSTIGTEKLTNPALQIASRQQFVEELTSHLPPRPEYFAEDAVINREGADPLAQLPEPPQLEPDELVERQSEGAFILDVREASAYSGQHIPGSVCIALKGQFALWAGTVIGLQTAVVIVAEGVQQMREARMRLARVGLENVSGWLPFAAWLEARQPAAELPQITVNELQRHLENGWAEVMDVRASGEWEAGHIAGAHHYPLGQFATAVPRIDTEHAIAVHCKSGYRSLIAAGLLMRAGVKNVVNVVGGFDAWQAASLPVAEAKPAEGAAA